MFGRLSLGIACALTIAVGLALGLRRESEPTRLTVFAVGQGDCTLFQHQGVNVLVDAGPANEYSDAGKTLLFPKLREMGVDQIDLVLLSHPDTDHIGGLASLSRRIQVRKVAVLSHFRDHSALKDVLSRSRLKAQDVVFVNQPSQIRVGEWSLRISLPPYGKGDSDNQGSMFLWMGNGRASAVFSGDADMLMEAAMASRGVWKAQVMKAGHHGSKFSTGPEWLSAVQPRYVVFSCGRSNSYGHPSAEAVARAEKSGAKVLRTDRDGTVTFEAGEQGFVLVRP